MGIAWFVLGLEVVALTSFWLLGETFEFLAERDYRSGRRERRSAPR